MKQDRISGAAEIEEKAIGDIKKYVGRDGLFERCYELLSAYPSMASLWNIANLAFLYGKDAIKQFNRMAKANERIIEHGASVIKDNATVLTYSRSSTVSRILRACESKNIRAICSESRPKYEGRKLVRELCESNVDTIFTTDISLFSYVGKADMILMGTDAILKKGTINKIGTAALASHAKGTGKDVYMASSSHKAFPFVFIKEEGRKEIWQDSPDKVKVKNFYFDFTPVRHVDYFITEKGVSRAKPIFRHEVANEILEIKDKFECRYRLVE
ncbi:MAG: hypothetical protein U9O96_07445 [Candidatus Thermoplasmatota archaeon]|nr:hypothetical protein [Candidatus Thermoplasmatota archaeon]